MNELLRCLLLLACWILLAASFLGLGLTVTRLLRLGRTTPGRSSFPSIWIGLTAVVLILQILHFFVPIGPSVALPTMAAGLFLLLGRNNREFLRRAGARITEGGRPLLVVGAGLAIGLFLAYRALGQPAAYDTGMYHVPAVEWFRSFPLVPGLANLHGRLGYNNSGFLLASLFDASLPFFRSWHVTNGFFLLLLALRAMSSWVLLPNLAGASRRAALYDLFLTPVLLVLALDPLFISSLTAEVPVAVGVFFTGRWLLGAAPGDGAAEADAEDGLHSAFTTLVVLALLLTFKLSTLAWTVAGSMILVWTWRHHLFTGGSSRPRLAFGAGLMVASLLFASWAARGVVLSGHLAYPSPSTAVPVEWRVPLEQAAAEQAWVKHYARYFFDGTAMASRLSPYSFEWLVAWGEAAADDFRLRWLFFYALLITLGLSLAAVALRLRDFLGASAGWRNEDFLPATSWRVLLATGAALVFWFAMAPLPRLGFFLIWIVAAVLGASVLTTLTFPASLQRLVITGLTLAPLFTPALLEPPDGIRDLSARVADRLVDRQLRDEVLPPRSNAYVRRYETDSGLVLWVPRSDNRCWDAPLPCTPHPSPNLRLREPPDLGSGFVLNGTWAPERWPNPDSDFLERWREGSDGG